MADIATKQQRKPIRSADRTADIEQLAATIFVRRYCSGIQRTAETLAREALTAAREFYATADSDS